MKLSRGPQPPDFSLVYKRLSGHSRDLKGFRSCVPGTGGKKTKIYFLLYHKEVAGILVTWEAPGLEG